MVLQLGEIEIEDFIKKVDFGKAKQLIPVILQDASSDKVLMQAFMDEQALRLTLAKGRMHFWSRTRRKMWLKGEESGCHSLVQNAILDCDNDAILFKVQQIGTICHTGKKTCFHKPIIEEDRDGVDARILERIFEVAIDRVKNPTKESYVSSLAAMGEDAVLEKIDEETVELILATKDQHREDIVHEATDLLFHILVLFAHKGYELKRIFEELQKRHRKKTESTRA